MKSSIFLALLAVVAFASTAMAQVYDSDPVIYESPYLGAGSVGSGEPLFFYDDQENWKHGYLKIMPYYGGFHSFRPYNYHHVFSQSTTAQRLGMSPVMPYSQQFWYRYYEMTDLTQGDHEPVFPNIPPVESDEEVPLPPQPGSTPGQRYSPELDRQQTDETSAGVQLERQHPIAPIQYQQRGSVKSNAIRPFPSLMVPADGRTHD